MHDHPTMQSLSSTSPKLQFTEREFSWVALIYHSHLRDQYFSINKWTSLIVGDPSSSNRVALKKLLEKLHFETKDDPKNRGNHLIWGYDEAIEAQMMSLLTQVGKLNLSSPSSPPIGLTHTLEPTKQNSTRISAPPLKIPAIQRPLSAFIQLWKSNGWGLSVTVSSIEKISKDYKNTIAAAEVAGFLNRDKQKGSGATVRLTTLGIEAISDDPALVTHAISTVLNQYKPYVFLAQKASQGVSREKALQLLMTTFVWKKPTADNVFRYFLKHQSLIGQPISFGGQGKKDAVARTAKGTRRNLQEAPSTDLEDPDAKTGTQDQKTARKIHDLTERQNLFAPLAAASGGFFSVCAARIFKESYGSMSRGALTESALTKIFTDEFEKHKAAFFALQPSMDVRKAASHVMEAMQVHGWLERSTDYEARQMTYRPSPIGKRIMSALSQDEFKGASMSSGSFRSCTRALEDFIESKEAHHLIDALRSARDVNEDLASEADQWRAASNQLIAEYDDPHAFSTMSSKLTDRLSRARRQMGAHGVETNWRYIRALIEKINLRFPDDPDQLFELAEELSYAMGDDSIWGKDGRVALEWMLDEISSLMDSAKTVRGPELAETMNAFAKISEQLVSSRAAMGPSEKMVSEFKKLFNAADTTELETLATDIVENWLIQPASAIRTDQFTLMEARVSKEKEEPESIQVLDPWLLFESMAKNKAQQIADLSLSTMTEILNEIAAVRPFYLSELGQDGWSWAKTRVVMSAWSLSTSESSLFNCTAMGRGMVNLGGITQEDYLIELRKITDEDDEWLDDLADPIATSDALESSDDLSSNTDSNLSPDGKSHSHSHSQEQQAALPKWNEFPVSF